jgi:glycosyltransferase involved in cell wall biosynthesis
VVYLAHTPQWFPFGPASWNPDPEAAALVAGCAAIVAIGQHMAAYIERYTSHAPAVIHPPIYGHSPFPDYGCLEGGLVTMINPCELKGISIFLELARRMPDTLFAAIPGWGTNAEDRQRLEALPNFTMLPNARDIDEPLSRTRILLMPSLWYEGFGLSVMEAMLRGIPVISSDSGGLVEAKAGTGYVIPVHPIERYQPEFDEHALPRPVVPANDIGPWEAALRVLLDNREAYRKESDASRAAAHAFVGGLDASRLEHLLATLHPARPAAAAAAPQAPPELENLTPERRALLIRMLARKAH